MPITQHNMGSRSGTTNNPWLAAGPRRSGDNSSVVQNPGGVDALAPPEIIRISQRVGELERMLLKARRQAPGNDPPAPPTLNVNLPIPNPNNPIPSPGAGGMGPPA